MSRNAKPKRDDKAVKMDRALADKAAFVVRQLHRELGVESMAEYISEHMRGKIERDFDRAVKKSGTTHHAD